MLNIRKTFSLSEVNMELMIQGFEWYLPSDARHWKILRDKIDSWSELGVSAIWLPPSYKGHRGLEDSGYGVYDMYDLGEFSQKGSVSTKYGTKDEFIDLVTYIESKGIKVYHDIVLNHRLGGDDFEKVDVIEVNPNNREQQYREAKLDVWSKFTFTGRENKYSNFKWDYTHFKGSDAYQKIFLFKDKQWDKDVSLEFNNYDYLMGLDVDFNSPEVIQEIKEWSKWYFTLTQARAVRLDAIKHIQAKFFNWWLPYISELGVKEVVGEYWAGYDEELIAFLKIVKHQMKLFDVPFHYNMYDASLYEDYDLRYIFENTLIQKTPEYAVTFVDNHDTQLGQSLESWIKPWFKPMAYALTLLRPQGIPCVFYTDIEELDFVSEFMKLRKENLGVNTQDYFIHPHYIGWTSGDLIIIMSNKEKGRIEFEVEGTYIGVYGTQEIVESNQGKITLTIESRSMNIYRRKK